MALAAWVVGPARLLAQLERVDRVWFCAAVVVAACAQSVSVLRWASIARIFGLRVRAGVLALAYAQGMTVNVLLPGATLGGDALRSLRLQSLGNPLGVSALTVLLDRLSGLWVLCVLSLLTGIVLLIGVITGFVADPAAWLPAYLAALALACVFPLLPLRPRAVRARSTGRWRAWLERAWSRAVQWHELVLAQRVPLTRTLWSSLLVQALCAATLWLCLRAAGGDVAYWQVQAAAAPVFIAGALPVSYGGFGARELAAVAIFPLVGVPADLGLTASALYGVVAIVLGLLVAPAFAVRAGAVPQREN
jgi:uncharacterized membrane protein YbhN (UPF0104 family)